MVATLEMITALPNSGPTRVDFWTYRALPVGDFSSLSLDTVAVVLVGGGLEGCSAGVGS